MAQRHHRLLPGRTGRLAKQTSTDSVHVCSRYRLAAAIGRRTIGVATLFGLSTASSASSPKSSFPALTPRRPPSPSRRPPMAHSIAQLQSQPHHVDQQANDRNNRPDIAQHPTPPENAGSLRARRVEAERRPQDRRTPRGPRRPDEIPARGRFERASPLDDPRRARTRALRRPTRRVAPPSPALGARQARAARRRPVPLETSSRRLVRSSRLAASP